eukprot:11210985-Lingulodinium_polyedra.AAC.1
MRSIAATQQISRAPHFTRQPPWGVRRTKSARRDAPRCNNGIHLSTHVYATFAPQLVKRASGH